MTKKCIICGKEFKPRNSKHLCCSKECSKQHENDLRKEYKKQWRQRNKEHIKKYNRQWNEKNKEYRKEYKKQYYKQNKERYKEKNKQWNKKNKEYRKEYNKQWNEQNKEYKKQYHRTKYNTDLQYKLTKWSRDQVRRCLNSNKTKHTFDILGYTPEQLKQRLEIHFKPDMTWDNHGTLWHIDHRKPLCKFNFVLPDGAPNYEQIRLANSLANLQPLYITENLSKGGK